LLLVFAGSVGKNEQQRKSAGLRPPQPRLVISQQNV
jgi:hypothetical protein